MRQTTIGHVYVIKFTDGTVKAGRTSSPKTRIRSGSYGNRAIADFWVSEMMTNSRIMENNILRAINGMSASQIGREYFIGVDFQAAVEAAKNECDKEREMFIPEKIQEAKLRYAAAEEELARKTMGLLSASSRKNTDDVLIDAGLTAIRNAVFYSSLGMHELLDVVTNEVCSLDAYDGDAERIDRVLDLVDGCRSALALIAKVMTTEFTREDFSELHEYSIKSKEMLEGIRTVPADELLKAVAANDNGGAL